MIFEKMKMEGFAGNDDVRLCTLMTIPKNSVGRIIGKGGKNARDIEQVGLFMYYFISNFKV